MLCADRPAITNLKSQISFLASLAREKVRLYYNYLKVRVVSSNPCINNNNENTALPGLLFRWMHDISIQCGRKYYTFICFSEERD